MKCFSVLILVLLMNNSLFGQGQFKVRNDGVIQMGYETPVTLTFGKSETDSINNGRFAMRYCTSCALAGFEFFFPQNNSFSKQYSMFFAENGMIGVGRIPSNYQFDISGLLRSDRLFLRQPQADMYESAIVTNALNKLQLLKIFQFTPTKESGQEEKRYTISVEDLKTHFPELIHADKAEISTDYLQLIPILIAAIQEQQKEIEALRKELKKRKLR